MRQLLIEKIDEYLEIQERKEIISLSMDSSRDLKDVINTVKNSENKEKILSLFNDKIREDIQKLIDGGII